MADHDEETRNSLYNRSEFFRVDVDDDELEDFPAIIKFIFLWKKENLINYEEVFELLKPAQRWCFISNQLLDERFENSTKYFLNYY